LLWFLDNERIYLSKSNEDAKKAAETLFITSNKSLGSRSLLDIQESLIKASGMSTAEVFSELQPDIGINYDVAVRKILSIFEIYQFQGNSELINFNYLQEKIGVRTFCLSKQGLEAALKFQEHNDNKLTLNLQNNNTEEQIKISKKLRENSTNSFRLALAAVFLSVITVGSSLYRISLLEDKTLSHDDFEIRLNQLQVASDVLKSNVESLNKKIITQSNEIITLENTNVKPIVLEVNTLEKANIKPVFVEIK
jgi:hypothetical protein